MAIMSHKLKFNDQYVKVEIVSTQNEENFTRHTVRLLEPLGDLKAGDTLSECYSFVKPATAKMYGIKQDIFPSFTATREA
jgi:hypothetical protein